MLREGGELLLKGDLDATTLGRRYRGLTVGDGERTLAPGELRYEGASGPDPIANGEVEHVETVPHMQNWLQCLRTREQPNANVDAGYQHAVACILSDMAYVSGRRMVYDAKKRRIRPG